MDKTNKQSLAGRFLVASPSMKDPTFERTVIFVAGHERDKGAVGMVINRPSNVSLAEVYRQLGIENAVQSDAAESTSIGWGGPVQTSHGYILHSTEEGKQWDVSLYNSERLAVTASPDIVYAYARGEGPEHALFVLGCAAWEPGQLEAELEQKWWLTAALDPNIIFSMDMLERYDAALSLAGIDETHTAAFPSAFYAFTQAGHA